MGFPFFSHTDPSLNSSLSLSSFSCPLPYHLTRALFRAPVAVASASRWVELFAWIFFRINSNQSGRVALSSSAESALRLGCKVSGISLLDLVPNRWNLLVVLESALCGFFSPVICGCLDRMHLVWVAWNFVDDFFLLNLFVRFSWNSHALMMFTEGLDRDALKWVREVRVRARRAPPEP